MEGHVPNQREMATMVHVHRVCVWSPNGVGIMQVEHIVGSEQLVQANQTAHY